MGTCEYCSSKNILRYVCKCKNVKYCNERCFEKDKQWHMPKCAANLDGDLQ